MLNTALTPAFGKRPPRRHRLGYISRCPRGLDKSCIRKIQKNKNHPTEGRAGYVRCKRNTGSRSLIRGGRRCAKKRHWTLVGRGHIFDQCGISNLGLVRPFLTPHGQTLIRATRPRAVRWRNAANQLPACTAKRSEESLDSSAAPFSQHRRSLCAPRLIRRSRQGPPPS